MFFTGSNLRREQESGMSGKNEFFPRWCEQEAPPRSFRSLIKYGDPRGFKHPNRGMFRLMKETFGMTDGDFVEPKLCMEDLHVDVPARISPDHIDALRSIAGGENVSSDTYSRVRYSYGAGVIDALRLRHRIVENLPDIVVSPRDDADVEHIVQYSIITAYRFTLPEAIPASRGARRQLTEAYALTSALT
jgi:alkyldihydroxyacetonephosphate synthase